MMTFEKKTKKNNDTGYDLRHDYYSLIVPAFLRDYNINLLENDINFEEFYILLSGISDENFCTIVSTRLESDPKRIKDFTEGQMRIYEEWQQKLMNDYIKINKYKSGME